MAAVFCDEGLTWVAQRLVGDTTNAPALGKVLLFTNNLTPTTANVLADFTEMSAVLGYAIITITPANLGFNLDTTNHVATSAYTYKWQFSSVPITGATNATPIVISTVAVSHGLTTGAKVVISDVAGNTAANGTWTITVVDTQHFSLDTSVGNGAYVNGGSWGVPVYGWLMTDSTKLRAVVTERFAGAPLVVGGSRLTLAVTVNMGLKIC
jgi:hypothetical protein